MYWLAQIFLTFLLSLALGTILPSVDVAPNAEAAETEILLTGRVTSVDDGEPIANVGIDIIDSKASIDSSIATYTDASGYYTVTSVFFDTWVIRFAPTGNKHYDEYYNDVSDMSSATVFTSTPGLVLSGIDASLSAIGESQLSGRVTSETDGAPLEGVRVSVYDASGNFLQDSIPTNSNGVYTVTGLAKESYKLYYDSSPVSPFYVAEYYNDKATLAEADPVVVDSALVQGIDVSLARGGVISGRVTSSWEDRYFWGLQITVYNSDGEIVRIQGRNYPEQLSSGPEYSIPNLPPGAYRLRFADLSEEHRAEFYNNALNLDQATTIDVGLGPTGQRMNINAQLELIQKVVSVGTTTGIANTIIYAYAHDPAPRFTTDSGQHWQTPATLPWKDKAPNGYANQGYALNEVGLTKQAGENGETRLLYTDGFYIYRSSDLGQSWTSDSLGSCGGGYSSVEAIVVDPINPSQIYMRQTCTQSDFGTRYFYWLWFSDDAGDTWQDLLVAGWPESSGNQIVLSPVVSGRLYVDTGTPNVWNYRDGNGKPWEQKYYPVLTIVPDAENADILYGWSNNGSPVLTGTRSEDRGNTWTEWDNQPCTTPYRLLAHPSRSKVLLVRCFEGIYGSNDGGDSWQQHTTTGGQRLAPDYGTDGRVLWVTDDGSLAGSANNGASWQLLEQQPAQLRMPLYLPSIVTDEQD